MALLVVGGCVPGYQDTPYPPCFLPDDPDPACHAPQDDEGGSGDGTTFTPTTGRFRAGARDRGRRRGRGQLERDGSQLGREQHGDDGPEVQAPPMILGMSLTPGPGTPGSCVLQSAGPVTVTVQVEDAAEVWMTVDDGEAVALEPVGDDGTEFVGEIAVLGESWNGSHTVSAIAKSGELVSAPWVDMFTVDAPAAGPRHGRRRVRSRRATGTRSRSTPRARSTSCSPSREQPGRTRCHVRRRDALAVRVAAGCGRPSPPVVTCGGEDIKVAPDGTLWVLVNTFVQNAWRWELWHVDAEGSCWTRRRSVSPKHRGAGLDVSAAATCWCAGRGRALRYPTHGSGTSPRWATAGRCRGCTQVVQDELEAMSATRDCAFVEDRIVVVGEAFGKTVQNDDKGARGFVLELGRNSRKQAETITTTPGWQSGHEAVAPDGSGGYVAVGYSCDAKVVPCAPTQGVVRWFSLGGTEIWTEPVEEAQKLWTWRSAPAVTSWSQLRPPSRQRASSCKHGSQQGHPHWGVPGGT
jgi:hypothetical protein